MDRYSAMVRGQRFNCLSFTAAALCLVLWSAAVGIAAAQTAASTQASAPPSSDAAAQHAKRTACLKAAWDKKLLGADKTSFIKDCIAAPKR